MAEKTLLRGRLRQVVKGVYWTVTPWWVRRRVQALRVRFATRAGDVKTAYWIQREEARMALRRRGKAVPVVPVFDLCNDTEVARAVQPSGRPVFSWPPVQPEDVTDRWSAARWLIDLWRRRADVRGGW